MTTPKDGVDYFAGLHHELPEATIPDAPAKATRRRPRKRRALRQRPTFPKLANRPHNQAIAEFLTFYMWIDWLAGIAPCPARWPYSEYRRGSVEKLLERVRFTIPRLQGWVSCR